MEYNMELKGLKIGDKISKLPIIQGGMGVGVSMHKLAGAVAKAGGVGIISTADIGYQEPDFEKNPEEANLRAIDKEIKKAREIAPNGIIGVNVMVALTEYAEIVKRCVQNGIDLIISGAGLPKAAHSRSKAAFLVSLSCLLLSLLIRNGRQMDHYRRPFIRLRLDQKPVGLAKIQPDPLVYIFHPDAGALLGGYMGAVG